MAFGKYKKKYEMNKKEAEAALQDILAASGQDDIAGCSIGRFTKKAANVKSFGFPLRLQ